MECYIEDKKKHINREEVILSLRRDLSFIKTPNVSIQKVTSQMKPDRSAKISSVLYDFSQIQVELSLSINIFNSFFFKQDKHFRLAYLISI